MALLTCVYQIRISKTIGVSAVEAALRAVRRVWIERFRKHSRLARDECFIGRAALRRVGAA